MTVLRPGPGQRVGLSFERILPGLFRSVLDGEAGAGPDAALVRRASLLAAHARHHRIETLLARWFLDAVPAPAGGFDPRAVIERAKVRALGMRTLAGRLSARFDAAGVRHLWVRGPVIAELCFPESHLRSYRDLDIVVRREDLPRSGDLLRGEGFAVQGDPAGWEREGEQPFTDGRSVVELHWHVYPRVGPREPETAGDPWRDAVVVRVGGTAMAAPDATHLLLSSCLHAVYEHKLDRLVRLVDLRQIAARLGASLDWPRFLEGARLARAETGVFFALAYARRFTGAGFPEPVLAQLRSRCRGLGVLQAVLPAAQVGGLPSAGGRLRRRLFAALLTRQARGGSPSPAAGG
jgi:hypothetical protein